MLTDPDVLPPEGRLRPIATKVLMKVFYAARLARFDLLRAVCHLAQYITKSDAPCEKRACRLMCY